MKKTTVILNAPRPAASQAADMNEARLNHIAGRAAIAFIMLVIVLFLTLTNTIEAAALDHPTDKGPRVNSHMTTDKPAQSCHNWKDNGWIIEPDSYFVDDGQTAESNYSDYLGDFFHYFTQYPGTCKTAPAPMP